MRDEQHHVVGILTAFLNGALRRSDWKDFTSSALRDAELDRIRRCAATVPLPPDAEGEAILRELLDQAALLSEDDPQRPKVWRIEAGLGAGLLVGAVFWWLKYLPGAGLFHNLHLFVVPAAIGGFLVVLRNSRKRIGAYDPRIVVQNRKGRV